MMRCSSGARPSTTRPRMLALSALIFAVLGAGACGGSDKVAGPTPSAASASTTGTAPPAETPRRPTPTTGPAVASPYRAHAAAPGTVIALSGRKALAVDTETGDVQELITAPDTVPPYDVPFRFTPSPDGALFAYTCSPDGSAAEGRDKHHLCVLGSDGALAPPIVRTEDLEAGEFLSPGRWSPDGRRLVFRDQLLIGPGAPPVWTFVFDFETSRSTRAFRGLDVGPALWSPDGSRLAAANATGVFVMRMDTGDSINIAGGVIPAVADLSLGNVAWSPDGASVAFTLGDAGHYNEKLYVASADGSNVRRVGAGGTGVVWSPDGRWIARSIDPRVIGESGCTNFPCRQLWIVRADGSDDRRLAEGLADGESPSWAPDSQRVAFLGVGTADHAPRGFFGLFVVAIDGGTPQLLSGDLTLTGSPSITWSAGGDGMLFTAYPDVGPGGACGQGGCPDGYLFMVGAAGAETPRQLYADPVHEISRQ